MQTTENVHICAFRSDFGFSFIVFVLGLNTLLIFFKKNNVLYIKWVACEYQNIDPSVSIITFQLAKRSVPEQM